MSCVKAFRGHSTLDHSTQLVRVSLNVLTKDIVLLLLLYQWLDHMSILAGVCPLKACTGTMQTHKYY